MTVSNAHWYNRNAGRAYPLDDAASGEDDAGRPLPPDVVVDLSLRWPSDLGVCAFLAAVSLTPRLVTVTVQAAPAADAAAGFVPLAVVSAVQPLRTGRVVPFRPQAPGVAGWVVFGGGARPDAAAYAARFSGPAQSRLAWRCARPYRPLPVRSVRAHDAAAPLDGVVTVRAVGPLAVAKEERFLDGAYRDAVVLRLVEDGPADRFPLADGRGRDDGVFRRFAGPCGGRPESGTCGCPEPVETVNAVAPDCDGTVTLEFRGCARVSRLRDAAGRTVGVALSCPVGLVDVCLPPRLPSSDGLLPFERPPADFVLPPDGGPPDGGPASESYPDPPVLPLVVCCDVPGVVPFVQEAGAWEWSADGPPSAVCPGPVSASLSAAGGGGSVRPLTASGRRLAVAAAATGAVRRRAVTEFRLEPGPAGAGRNAQLVCNYRPDGSYWAAEVDHATQSLRLVRFAAGGFADVPGAAVMAPGVVVGRWYRLECTAVPAAGDAALVTARLSDPAADGFLDVTLSAVVPGYRPADGRFGVGTDQAVTRFAYLVVEEAG